MLNVVMAENRLLLQKTTEASHLYETGNPVSIHLISTVCIYKSLVLQVDLGNT